MLVVLTFLVEHGGGASAMELGAHLFGAGRTAMADRLLHAGAELGLAAVAEDGWHLTEAGIDAVAAGHVLTPEFGVWRLELADDPLLDWDVISVTRLRDPNLYDGTQAARGRVHRHDKALPSHVTGLVGVTLSPLADPVNPVVITEVASGAAVAVTPSRQVLLWDPVAGQVDISSEGGDPPARVSGPSVPLPALLGLHADMRWDDEKEALLVPAAALDDDELMDGAFTWRSRDRVRVEPYGEFDGMEIDRVRARPVDTQDAGAWLRRRLRLLVTDYATSSRWEHWTESASADLGVASSLPSRDSLAAELVSAGSAPGRDYWFLRAAADWDV